MKKFIKRWILSSDIKYKKSLDDELNDEKVCCSTDMIHEGDLFLVKGNLYIVKAVVGSREFTEYVFIGFKVRKFIDYKTMVIAEYFCKEADMLRNNIKELNKNITDTRLELANLVEKYNKLFVSIALDIDVIKEKIKIE